MLSDEATISNVTIASDIAELFLHNFSYITVWHCAYHRLDFGFSNTADEVVEAFINIHSYKSSQNNYLFPVHLDKVNDDDSRSSLDTVRCDG